MRIIQIIDSLETGGAERMAVNYANALSRFVAFSGLVATRKEGGLRSSVVPGVDYLFLEKKSTLDPAAVLRLRKYCVKNRIDLVHAHSTSYFVAMQLKMVLPSIGIVWHDHFGMSEFLESRPAGVLRVASLFFDGIISVNTQLENWAKRKLFCSNVINLPNFIAEQNNHTQTELHGHDGKRILCLANLREQKDHHMLLSVARSMKASHPEWTFHLIGKDFEDAYSKSITQFIEAHGLSDNVYIYGARHDISSIIDRCEIGVLTSRSEGLPVALLEYGMHRKAVVVTSVGEIPSIIENGINGMIIPSGDASGFCRALIKLADDRKMRVQLGSELFETVNAGHSEKTVINRYLNWISPMI